MTPADDEARARVIVMATRQAFVKQLAGTRRNVLLGVVMSVVGLAMLVACVVVALKVGEVTIAGGGLGFLLLVIGCTRIVRSLLGAMSVRRQLRDHDARALPAARVVQR